MIFFFSSQQEIKNKTLLSYLDLLKEALITFELFTNDHWRQKFTLPAPVPVGHQIFHNLFDETTFLVKFRKTCFCRMNTMPEPNV